MSKQIVRSAAAGTLLGVMVWISPIVLLSHVRVQQVAVASDGAVGVVLRRGWNQRALFIAQNCMSHDKLDIGKVVAVGPVLPWGCAFVTDLRWTSERVLQVSLDRKAEQLMKMPVQLCLGDAITVNVKVAEQ